MKLSFITLFPNLIEPYFQDSIMFRAKENGLFNLKFINPRDYTKDKHKKVDSPLVGGGAGQLMRPQPLFDTIKTLEEDAYIIACLPAGKEFCQQDAKRLAKKKHLCFICGRYEGLDERVVEKYADEVLSIGQYVLSGGELAAMVMSDAILRNLKGVLGNENSLKEESFENGLLEAPSFTKPKKIENILIPSELLKGNHARIADFKKAMSYYKSKFHKPELYIIEKIKDKK